MRKIDLEAHLQANRKAAKHADSIRQTLDSLESLRSKGLQSRGYTLVSPFGSRAKVAVPAKGKGVSRMRIKLTEDA